MKLLTIIISEDLEHEVAALIAAREVDCYVKLSEAYGISRSCQGVVSPDLPWAGRLLLVAGEEKELVELAESIQAQITGRPYKPCLRMMISPVERVWK